MTVPCTSADVLVARQDVLDLAYSLVPHPEFVDRLDRLIEVAFESGREAQRRQSGELGHG